jgi:hypothetical protein
VHIHFLVDFYNLRILAKIGRFMQRQYNIGLKIYLISHGIRLKILYNRKVQIFSVVFRSIKV